MISICFPSMSFVYITSQKLTEAFRSPILLQTFAVHFGPKGINALPETLKKGIERGNQAPIAALALAMCSVSIINVDLTNNQN
jgi:hypothetical protein